MDVDDMVRSDQMSDELDLTNGHLRTLEDVELKPTLKYLDLTANRLHHIEPKLASLSQLTWLCLRQNLLSEPAEIESLSSAPLLRHLELRDNQFTSAPNLGAFAALTYLELSYNEIRGLEPLKNLEAAGLEELYVAQNKVAVMESLSQLTSLRVLELGSNRIRCIENIESLQCLQELWLGRNRIREIAGLENLSSLRRLSLQSNRLESMAGLQTCTALEELYLSHNGIERIEGLESMPNLKILDVASNRLNSLEGLQSLDALTDLWANDNAIAVLDQVEDTLRPMRQVLTCVYLHGNPCAAESNYKLRMLHLLPNLEQLDDKLVDRQKK